jgi:hypothetical protein
MALPIESLRPEILIMERAEKKAAVERLPAATPSQQFLKDTLLMVVGAKVKMEVSSSSKKIIFNGICVPTRRKLVSNIYSFCIERYIKVVFYTDITQ